MNKLFKILFIVSLLFSSSYAGWKWSDIRHTAKAKISKYLIKKRDNMYKKYNTNTGTGKQKTLQELAKNNKI